MSMAVPRALVVGLICALVHNAIMIAGDFAGLHYAASLIISVLIVVVIGYRLHSGWTFRTA
ncbi:MAG: GtrA family protein, partial [Burkholderiales bacterium]